MKVEVSLILFTILVPVELFGRIIFECPPPEQIHPCICVRHPINEVKCDDVRNLDIISNALVHSFSAPLPSLRVTNVHTYELPHHAFRNISTKKLYLKDSSFRRIDDQAFVGQDSLGLLVLSEDRLTEFPAEAIKNLVNLRTLSLAGNFLMKIYENSVSHLRNLKFLLLSDNRLSSIERESFPRSLDTLGLSRNLLTSLNGSVKNLPNLEVLLISNNRLVEINGQFDGLSNLNYLNLDLNNIRDISNSFDDLRSLKHLNLAYNSLKEVENGLYPLTKLRALNLSYNYITEVDENLFKILNSVQVLDLSGNYIQNVCQVIKPLKNLKELYLSNCDLKSLDIDCFRGMKNLQILDLSQNELTDINAVTGDSFPNLKMLNLQNNLLENFRRGLKNIKHLQELNIEDNKFSSIKGHHFMHNVKLTTLKIEGNPWDCTDQLFDVLRDLETKSVKILGTPSCYLEENLL